jgi:hypothetical protein
MVGGRTTGDAPGNRRTSFEMPNMRASLDLLGDGVGRHGGFAVSNAQERDQEDFLELQRAALEKVRTPERGWVFGMSNGLGRDARHVHMGIVGR